jgi:DNA relaxase NicK
MEVKIDYFSVTFPLDCDSNDNVLFKVHEMVALISEYLNIQGFEVNKEMYAQNNFRYQYTLGEAMTLRLDGPLDDSYQKTCHFELKGEGCREFELRNPDKDWRDLILFFVSINGKFKRIDIAIDDYKGDFIQLEYLYQKMKKHCYTSIFKSNPKPMGTLEDGLTIQFGSNKSDTELVIYDKLHEQLGKRKVVNKEYWVRYEMRFRHRNAESIACLLIRDYEKLMMIANQQLYRILDIKEDNSYSIRDQARVATDDK